VPSHCSLMKDAAAKLAERLAQTKIHQPAIPVLHNLDAEARRDADAIRQALKEQLYRPVRWTQTVRNLQAQGITQFFECGPGKVLCGLGKRISAEIKNGALEDGANLAAAVEVVKAA
jgi:[acyl-carrier-protein] S-malonyltransferase